MGMSLPETPDFAALDQAAAVLAGRQKEVLTEIGVMGLGWSNNESVFVYVLMILLQIDEVSAAIIFATLNTTRARIDLIRRLAKVKIADAAVAQGLSRLLRRFDACTQIRNEFNHCVYTLNEKGEITHTQALRLQETRNSLSLGTLRAMDESRVGEIKETNRQLKRLNRDLWAFLPVLKAHIETVASKGPA